MVRQPLLNTFQMSSARPHHLTILFSRALPDHLLERYKILFPRAAWRPTKHASEHAKKHTTDLLFHEMRELNPGPYQPVLNSPKKTSVGSVIMNCLPVHSPISKP